MIEPWKGRVSNVISRQRTLDIDRFDPLRRWKYGVGQLLVLGGGKNKLLLLATGRNGRRVVGVKVPPVAH